MTAAYSDVARALLAQRWVFAKTMRDNQHWWTQRRDWQGDISIDDAIRFIRDTGYRLKFSHTIYRCVDVGEHRYWSMGGNVLINRARNIVPHVDMGSYFVRGTPPDAARQPTNDEALGIAWWNGLTERDRAHWLRVAGSAVAADAWATFRKRGQ